MPLIMFVTSCLLLAGFIFTPVAFAEVDPALDQLHKKLVEKHGQAETRMAQLNEAAAALEEERAKVAEAANAVDLEKKSVEQATEEPVDQALLEKLFLNGPVGSCTIQRGETANEFYIHRKSDDVKIRMIFAAVDAPERPSARYMVKDTVKISEIRQPEFTPSTIDTKNTMSATIRYDVLDFRLLHAVFKGELINDRMFSYSSFKPKTVSCAL